MNLARFGETVYSVWAPRSATFLMARVFAKAPITRMAVDVNKQLDRARRFLEKNKIEDAIDSYQLILNEIPTHVESLQAMGDAFTTQGQSDKAVFYYGLLFDRLFDTREENKALAIYTRALKGIQQPADRMQRYALLLQKQSRFDEAIEQYTLASELFLARGQQEFALECLEHIAQIDGDNAARYVAVAVLAEQVGKTPLASRNYLRAGQLGEAAGDGDSALRLFARAQELAPAERTPALLYAQALMRRNQAPAAAKLLEPFADGELDSTFAETVADVFMQSGQLDRAARVLDRLPVQQPATAPKLFELAGYYLAQNGGLQAVAWLREIQSKMTAAKRENDFATRLDVLVGSHNECIPLAEFCAAAYAEMSREAKYFDALVHLFDLYVKAGNFTYAAETLEKLLDIDPYDSRNEERIKQIQGKTDAPVFARIQARYSQVANQGATAPVDAVPSSTTGELPNGSQAFEDLIVQAEIFAQYSLLGKAIERLQMIAQMFPAETKGNDRFRRLCELANWWPAGTERSLEPAPVSSLQHAAASEPVERHDSAGTMRDFTKVAEISQSLLRQSSPRRSLRRRYRSR